ncbi:MAG: hypothetical protein V4634_14890 [Pseudomonadota bacterium]
MEINNRVSLRRVLLSAQAANQAIDTLSDIIYVATIATISYSFRTAQQPLLLRAIKPLILFFKKLT